MKYQLSTDTNNALEMIGSVLHKVVDAHRWIGDNSIHLDKKEVHAFVLDKLVKEKHITVRQYENRVCVDLGLSGRNSLHIDL